MTDKITPYAQFVETGKMINNEVSKEVNELAEQTAERIRSILKDFKLDVKKVVYHHNNRFNNLIKENDIKSIDPKDTFKVDVSDLAEKLYNFSFEL